MRYVPQVPTTQQGTINLAIIDDPNIDPSILLDRQLKLWYANITSSFEGSVYAGPEVANCSRTFKEDKDYYHITRSTNTLDDLYQGKLVCAATGVPTATYLGELILEYRVILCDEEVAPGTIANASVSQTVQTINLPIEAGAGQPLSSSSFSTVPPGVYSLVSNSDYSISGAIQVNKPLNIGSEFIVSVIGGNLMTFYASMADLVNNNPVLTTAAYAALSISVRMYPLVLSESQSSGD